MTHKREPVPFRYSIYDLNQLVLSAPRDLRRETLGLSPSQEMRPLLHLERGTQLSLKVLFVYGVCRIAPPHRS